MLQFDAETAKLQSVTNVAKLGELLGAATSCGSCLPELRPLIAAGNAAA